MIRRTVLVAAAAAALVLVPSAAMAYNASGYTCTVSDSTPASGVPFTVDMTGAEANDDMTLTITSTPTSISSSAIKIAGTKAIQKTASATGAVSFTVTLSAPGSYALVMTENNAMVSSQTVTVAAAAAAGVPAAGGQLSSTGFDSMPLAVGGGVLVLVGAGAVVVARRRKTAQVPA